MTGFGLQKTLFFFHCLFHFNLNCLFGQDWLLGSQVINWSKKIAPTKDSTAIRWVVSSRCPRNLKLAAYEQDLFFFWGTRHISFLHESLSAIFHFVNVNVNKTHFPATATRVSRPWRFWDIIENRACAAVVHGFSKPRTTFECIYTNTFTSKVSRGLEKPIPKPLGQDKLRLELALGWISREHRFCTIYTGCSHLM